MTQTEKSSRKVINGAGWVNPLTHDYRVDLAVQVHVFADEVELVGGVDYSVSNLNNDAGYVVTITNAGAWAPTVWVLDARPAIDQGSDISLGGQFGQAFEDALDKLTRRVQRVYDLARRGLKTSLSTAVADNPYTLPAPVANKLLGWNEAGDDIENFDPTSIGIALVDDDATLGSSSATRVPSQRAVKTYVDTKIADLRDWNGLDLTGNNDMATLAQAAFNATAAAGVKLNIPGGKITLGSTVTVPKYANIEGAGNPATGASGLPSASPMTFFHLAHLGVGFDLTGGVSDGPRRVAGFGTYRDQAAPGVGWTPINAEADIQLTGVYDATAEDLFFYNPTVAIKATGNTGNNAGNGRITLSNLRGQPLFQGINMTHVYDIVFIDDIAWWPYWSLDSNVSSYTHNNAQAMVLGRVDWPIIGRIFSIRMKDGLYITNQAVVGTLPGGTTTNLHADNIGVDSCQRGLVIDAAAAAATLSIDRLICTNPTADTPPFIAVAGTNAIVDIRDITGANTNGSLIDISGSGNKVRVGTSHSYGIDTDASGTPEFNVAAGNELTLMAKPITSAGTIYSTTGTIRTPDWRAFTPTITTSSGTVTTLGTLACKYKLEGTTCHFDYEIPITTNGTGAGVLSATLPIQAKKTGGGPAGYVSANMLKGVIAGGASQRVDITTYNNAYPGGDGLVIRIAGSYEVS